MASTLFKVHMKRFALIAVTLVAFTGSSSASAATEEINFK